MQRLRIGLKLIHLVACFAASLVLMLYACSKSDEPVHTRPGTEQPGGTDGNGPGDNNPYGPHDMTEALKSSEPRYLSPDLTIKYQDGGIIFENNRDGRLRIIDLKDDHLIEFEPSVQLLLVDGMRIELSYCAETRRNDEIVWYNLTRASDSSQIIIVSFI